MKTAAGRLQEISVRSGPGSSKPRHGPVASSPLWSLLFLFIFCIQKPKTVTTTGYYAVRGPLGAGGGGEEDHRLSVGSTLLRERQEAGDD